MDEQPQQRPPNPDVAKKRFDKFVKVFEDVGYNTGENAKLLAALVSAIADEKDGLTGAIDDLIDEIRGLREDLRMIDASGRTAAVLAPLAQMFNGPPRRRS
jgi:hypothetical protein